jgi:hypothetical protein
MREFSLNVPQWLKKGLLPAFSADDADRDASNLLARSSVRDNAWTLLGWVPDGLAATVVNSCFSSLCQAIAQEINNLAAGGERDVREQGGRVR